MNTKLLHSCAWLTITASAPAGTQFAGYTGTGGPVTGFAKFFLRVRVGP
jgi:hypothetical protein